MNPIIKKQLESCRVANIPMFDENTTVINIPKGSVMTVTPYQIGKFYLVELADFVINPEDRVFASNWNNGAVPKYKYYNCEIKKVMGKMIFIFGCGYDASTQQDTMDLWEGWVPQTGIKILQELK